MALREQGCVSLNICIDCIRDAQGKVLLNMISMSATLRGPCQELCYLICPCTTKPRFYSEYMIPKATMCGSECRNVERLVIVNNRISPGIMYAVTELSR
uniref:Uncharacterized protein n=1 Tax=Nelumbo nucifera TaxID=4432 RepID=A0A822ZMR2_NELNU|nr:TPA_asm: hypothetical protein HUJ06_001298 [Nelumbo nucifera]